MVHLDYRSARPIYAQIMDGLKEQVSAGVNPYREAYLDAHYPGIRENEYKMATAEQQEEE